MRVGASLSLVDALALEKKMTEQFMKDHDFFEGVRCVA